MTEERNQNPNAVPSPSAPSVLLEPPAAPLKQAPFNPLAFNGDNLPPFNPLAFVEGNLPPSASPEPLVAPSVSPPPFNPEAFAGDNLSPSDSEASRKKSQVLPSADTSSFSDEIEEDPVDTVLPAEVLPAADPADEIEEASEVSEEASSDELSDFIARLQLLSAQLFFAQLYYSQTAEAEEADSEEDEVLEEETSDELSVFTAELQLLSVQLLFAQLLFAQLLFARPLVENYLDPSADSSQEPLESSTNPAAMFNAALFASSICFFGNGNVSQSQRPEPSATQAPNLELVSG